MAFLLAQAGTTLYKVDTATGTATALTLPTGVTLSSSRKPKFAVLDQWVVMVNSPSKNLAIDTEGTVRVLVPEAPTNPPITSNVAGGSALTGTYKYWQSFIVKDADGNLLMESPLSDPSVELTVTADDIEVGELQLSADAITGRRLYRNLTGGSLPYRLFDVDDNFTNSVRDGIADTTLELLPSNADGFVTPPGSVPGFRLKNIVEWKSRLWGVCNDPTLVDTVFATDTNKVYTWPNSLIAHPKGAHKDGVVGFGVRKNHLGFLKRVGVWAISATSSGTGINFDNLVVSQIAPRQAGCLSEDTILTIHDKVYWLGRDGVYEWDDTGVHSITDETVAPWFKTSTYFNRTRFGNAFARYNAVTNSYELHLAAAGDSTENRWVSFNLTNRKWFGPHKTGAFTPTHAGDIVDANDLPLTIVGGSDGVLYLGNSANKRDGSATAIDMDCYGPWHIGEDPDDTHYWGQLSVLSKVESAGTMEVIPTVGRLDTAAQTAITHTLTTGRERLRRLGVGPLMRLRFRKNTVNQSASVYGYEVPWHRIGRR
jgi:hypothetical protein